MSKAAKYSRHLVTGQGLVYSKGGSKPSQAGLYGPVVWKISTACLFWTVFVHPVPDASLERFEAEPVRSPALSVCSVFSSTLNSAQFELCLQPPTALQTAVPGPFLETTRFFLVCLTLSLQMDRRA